MSNRSSNYNSKAITSAVALVGLVGIFTAIGTTASPEDCNRIRVGFTELDQGDSPYVVHGLDTLLKEPFKRFILGGCNLNGH